MNKKIFIGIEVSKETLDLSINGKHIKINNNLEAIYSLYKKDISSKEITLYVLEPTGGYELLVMRVLQEHGAPVHRAHPNKFMLLPKLKVILLKLIN
jgi:transposase